MGDFDREGVLDGVEVFNLRPSITIWCGASSSPLPLDDSKSSRYLLSLIGWLTPEHKKNSSSVKKQKLARRIKKQSTLFLNLSSRLG